MWAESNEELATRAADAVLAGLETGLLDLTIDELRAGVAALIRRVFAAPEVWNPTWDM
jgi:hypothetical protein